MHEIQWNSMKFKEIHRKFTGNSRKFMNFLQFHVNFLISLNFIEFPAFPEMQRLGPLKLQSHLPQLKLIRNTGNAWNSMKFNEIQGNSQEIHRKFKEIHEFPSISCEFFNFLEFHWISCISWNAKVGSPQAPEPPTPIEINKEYRKCRKFKEIQGNSKKFTGNSRKFIGN